jgi:hypothetical protein
VHFCCFAIHEKSCRIIRKQTGISAAWPEWQLVKPNNTVIPAQAGIQRYTDNGYFPWMTRFARPSGRPCGRSTRKRFCPACAGMTNRVSSTAFGFLRPAAFAAVTGHQPPLPGVKGRIHHRPFVKTTPAQGVALVLFRSPWFFEGHNIAHVNTPKQIAHLSPCV